MATSTRIIRFPFRSFHFSPSIYVFEGFQRSVYEGYKDCLTRNRSTSKPLSHPRPDTITKLFHLHIQTVPHPCTNLVSLIIESNIIHSLLCSHPFILFYFLLLDVVVLEGGGNQWNAKVIGTLVSDE